MSVSLVIVLLLVLAAEFTNGLTDAPNTIATVVSTRVLSPYRAVAMAAVLNILGVLVTGTAVAVTIGKGIVKPEGNRATHCRSSRNSRGRLEYNNLAIWPSY